MRYTNADDVIVHPGTGHPYQQQNLPVRSTVDCDDFNMIIWSMMAVVEQAGLAAADFNPNAPASYQVFRNALMRVAVPVGSVQMRYDNVNPQTLYPGTTWVEFGQGRMPIGRDAADAEFDTVGETGGSKAVSLTVAQLPAHSHTVVIYDPDDVSPVRPAGTGTGSGTSANGSTENTGSGDPHSNMPPYVVVRMWHRTA